MKNKLNVFINQLKTGELWLDNQRRFCFQYDKNWADSPDSHRLSVSLPLREDPFINDAPYSYFTNLLPEGKILNVLSTEPKTFRVLQKQTKLTRKATEGAIRRLWKR